MYTFEEYVTLFKAAYDPHGLIIASHKTVNKLAKQMMRDGFAVQDVYKAADIARDYWGLEKIKRHGS